MAIINYQARAKIAQEQINKDTTITEESKLALKKFLNAYDVSPARELIFLENIRRFLQKCDNVNEDIQNPEKINTIFKSFKGQYGAATIDTIKNVSNTFSKWLNNGTKPHGFKDIKRDRKDTIRQLSPDDMITWDEGLQIAEQTNSIQIKAIFLTQLDCGFRPSEFESLNYGDVKIDGDIVIFHVREGKTGKRDVWMQRAVPQFLNWYDSHPLKTKDAPLWIMENAMFSHRKTGKLRKYERYGYRSMLARTDLMFARAGINKPKDFYNLRHSSCVLDKLDNVPLDLAAERHGHSVKFFDSVYGRLDIEGKLSRVRQHYGKPEEKKQLLRNAVCVRCHAINEPDAEYCRDCGAPLSAATAAKVFNEAQVMKDKLDNMSAVLSVLVDSNPRIKTMLEDYKKRTKSEKKND